MSSYGFSVPKSIPKYRHWIFKGELNLQNKAWGNFCHSYRQRFAQVWFFSLAQRTWRRKLLPTADKQRGEKWNSAPAPSFPLYNYSDHTEEENKGLRTLLIFNCCLPKSQWFYTNWFMSLIPMTHIAVQLSEKALTLNSDCFKTYAHNVKRMNIYSIIAGSFNTRILYGAKIEQNILIHGMKHWDILGIPKDDFETMGSTGKN